YGRRQPQAEPGVWAATGRSDPAAADARPVAPVAPTLREAGVSRVLVTGASGFIGSRVAEILRLREGCDVRAVVHNPGNASRLARLDVEMVQASLESEADTRRLVEGCDAVVHCAIGTAWGDRRKIFDVTVGGTRRL